MGLRGSEGFLKISLLIFPFLFAHFIPDHPIAAYMLSPAMLEYPTAELQEMNP
jgi:hypothetical protein